MSPEERERELAELRGERPQRDWMEGSVDAMEKRVKELEKREAATRAAQGITASSTAEPPPMGTSLSPEPGSPLHVALEALADEEANLPFVSLV